MNDEGHPESIFLIIAGAAVLAVVFGLIWLIT